MNEQRINLSYAAIVADNRPLRAIDPVQVTLDELEQSGRDLRNVTLDEFKTLLARNVKKQLGHAECLVGC